MATRNRSGGATWRQDLLLVGVPVAFLLTVLQSRWVVGSTRFAVAAGSIVCLGLLVDGLFVNPPVPDERD